MKKITSIFLSLLLTACVSGIIGSSGLQLENHSQAWFIRDVNNDIVTLTSQTFPDVYVRLDLRNILYNAGLSRSSCYDKINAGGINVVYPIAFSIGDLNSKVEKGIQYSFNPTKSYFLKNGRKYPVKIVDIFNLRTSPQDQYYDFSQDIQRKGCVTKNFSSPLICGELEQAVIVIDGIKINNQVLPSIRLLFNFTNPQSLPLFGN